MSSWLNIGGGERIHEPADGPARRLTAHRRASAARDDAARKGGGAEQQQQQHGAGPTFTRPANTPSPPGRAGRASRCAAASPPSSEQLGVSRLSRLSMRKSRTSKRETPVSEFDLRRESSREECDECDTQPSTPTPPTPHPTPEATRGITFAAGEMILAMGRPEERRPRFVHAEEAVGVAIDALARSGPASNSRSFRRQASAPGRTNADPPQAATAAEEVRAAAMGLEAAAMEAEAAAAEAELAAATAAMEMAELEAVAISMGVAPPTLYRGASAPTILLAARSKRSSLWDPGVQTAHPSRRSMACDSFRPRRVSVSGDI